MSFLQGFTVLDLASVGPAARASRILADYGMAVIKVAPVSGKVVEVNQKLESSAFLINEDPYGAGWIYRIELGDFANDARNLLQAEGYLELMKEKLAEEMKKK
jgi:glycine cleavage system H lipoate-binding protein